VNKWKRYIPSLIYGVLTVLQIVFWFAGYTVSGLEWLRYVGWALWGLSVVFGWMPMLTLRQKGEVPKGKAYIHTTALVDTGVYAIVRHPQYVAGILLNLALIFITQHWVIAALGIPAMVLMYTDIVKADQAGIARFGDEYKRYMETVPRMNFLAGTIRLLGRRKGD